MRLRPAIWVVSCLMVVICAAMAQTPAPATGSISGRVTLSGRPLGGIILTLQRSQPNQIRSSPIVARAETGEDGSYLFRQIPAGNYLILPLSPHLILEDGPSNGIFGGVGSRLALTGDVSRHLALAEGEALEKIEIALIRGGVITGKIVDAQGSPIIGEQVDVERVDQNGRGMGVVSYFREGMRTDDRGIYRFFGLYPGRYRVFVGQNWHPSSRRGGRAVFHPGITDEVKATIVEVKAGEDATGVDIKLPDAERGYQMAGRVVEVSTGAPLPFTQVGYGTKREQDTYLSNSFIAATTNEKGEFRLTDIPPGIYYLYAYTSDESDHYSDLTTVEVTGQNVDGVVVKANRGSTVSGWVTIEGRPDREVFARLSELRLFAYRRTSEMVAPRPGGVPIDSNGRFIFRGLRPGRYSFGVDFRSQAQGFNLIRIEQGGATPTTGIDLIAGKDVKDLRLVIAHGTATIRGRVIQNNGGVELPENAHLYVIARTARNPEFPALRPGTTRADRKGNFTIEGLAPGDYEVSVSLQYDPPSTHRHLSINSNGRTVSVKSGETATIEIPVEVNRVERKR